MSHRPIRDSLRSIDPARAHLQTALIGALNQRVIAGLHTVARLASERDRRAATAWIQFSAGDHLLAIAPLLIDGTLARVSGSHGRPDAAGAAASLSRIEPLVAALEMSLGSELHPAGLEPDVDADAILVRLDANTSAGEMRDRLLIAVPPALAFAPLDLPAILPSAIAGIKLRWTARLAGPAIAASRLPTIGIGDLILLGIGPHVARLALPGRNSHPLVRIDPTERVLILQETPERNDDGLTHGTTPLSASANATDLAEVRVPITIEIAGTTLTAAELATLNAGSVLPLPGNGGTICVRVIAGDSPIGDGELVAIGQGFGVLMTATASRTEG